MIDATTVASSRRMHAASAIWSSTTIMHPGAGGDNFSPKAACGAREIATAFLHNSDDDASMTMWRTKGFPFADFRFECQG